MNEIIPSVVSVFIIIWAICSGFIALVIFTATSESKEKAKEIAKTRKKYYWYIAASIALGPIVMILSFFIKDSKDSKNQNAN